MVLSFDAGKSLVEPKSDSVYLLNVTSSQFYEEAEKRAEAGDSESQYAMGMGCYKGHLCCPDGDFVEASRWLLKAAKQGHVLAQVTLGICYRNGEGLPKDEVEAYAYFNLAAVTDDEARNLLRELEDEMPRSAQLAGQARSRRLLREIEAKKAGK